MNRSVAQFFSVIGHPILVVTYGLLLLIWVNPYAFGARSLTDQPATLLLIMVFAYTAVIPGLGVLLMKPLGLVTSLEMPDKQERIGPYIVTGVFYLWLFKNLMSGGQVPPMFVQFVLGATIGLFLVFFFNIFTKISAHAAGMGGMVAATLLTAFEWGGSSAGLPVPGGMVWLSLNFLLAVVVVLAGLVGAARLALGAHTPPDLYRGYVAGIFAQVAAAWLL